MCTELFWFVTGCLNWIENDWRRFFSAYHRAVPSAKCTRVASPAQQDCRVVTVTLHEVVRRVRLYVVGYPRLARVWMVTMTWDCFVSGPRTWWCSQIHQSRPRFCVARRCATCWSHGFRGNDSYEHPSSWFEVERKRILVRCASALASSVRHFKRLR